MLFAVESTYSQTTLITNVQVWDGTSDKVKSVDVRIDLHQG